LKRTAVALEYRGALKFDFCVAACNTAGRTREVRKLAFISWSGVTIV
jgi:hypothetical protein